jgi:hypothetical protein
VSDLQPEPSPRPRVRPTTVRAASVVVALVVVVLMVLLIAPGIRRPGTTPAGPAQDTPARLEAYRGLGTWVDIFDTRAWKDPAAAVDDMAAHGVRTLFLQTGNSHSKTAFKDVPATEAFIRAAHARGMLVVAWYLPYLKSESLDLDRVTQAIRFKTSDGQAFDGFALDIESAAVKPLAKRIRALESLSLKIRDVAGPDYALGAIIPSPVGLARKTGYWDTFPYTSLARVYDAFLPMAYYTYHGKGADAVYADAAGSMRIIREQPGCETVPVHLIGGIAEKSNAAEVGAFVRAVNDTGCIGASIYGWTGTRSPMWKELGALKAP